MYASPKGPPGRRGSVPGAPRAAPREEGECAGGPRAHELKKLTVYTRVWRLGALWARSVALMSGVWDRSGREMQALWARNAPGRKQRGNDSKMHALYTRVWGLGHQWPRNCKRCARAAPGQKQRGNDLNKNIQLTLVSKVWDRNGRVMTSAVRARRAWLEEARERL